MSETMERGISQARADAVESETCQLITGLDALAAMGGMYDGDTVPAVQVRWFCNALKQHAEKILVYSDLAEDEPAA
jgi:hypothetical protein